MRGTVFALALGVCLLIRPPALSADEDGDDLGQIPSCGQISIDTALWQYSYDLYVSGYSQTRRALDGCASTMRVEAWVDEEPTGAVSANQGGGIAVSVSFGRAVPYYKTWTAIGKHWLINFGAWSFGGYSRGSTPVVPRPADDPPPSSSEDPLPMNGSGCPTCNSPLMIDRHGAGFPLTSAKDGVWFDIDGDGVLDRIAWTTADSEVAWLAYDRNGNGRIDDGTELFGNNTPAYAQQRKLKAENGFEALRFTQGPDYGLSEVNNLINGKDFVFSRLLLWTDRNHNGISEPYELESASAAGLVGIGLTYDEKKRRDENGNQFRLRGSSQWLEKGKVKDAPVWDVWLQGIK